MGLPRHTWDTLPFLLIVSPTRTICRRVRTYVRSVSHVTTKRKEVDHILWVWGSVPRARRTRGSPANMYTRDHDNLKSLKCCVFKSNFCYKMFCWGLYNNFHFCFQEIIHVYFPVQAPLVRTVTFLVQMNTVCRSYHFLMSMLGVYLSLTRYSTDLCKGEEILIQFSNKA